MNEGTRSEERPNAQRSDQNTKHTDAPTNAGVIKPSKPSNGGAPTNKRSKRSNHKASFDSFVRSFVRYPVVSSPLRKKSSDTSIAFHSRDHKFYRCTLQGNALEYHKRVHVRRSVCMYMYVMLSLTSPTRPTPTDRSTEGPKDQRTDGPCVSASVRLPVS